MKLGAQEDRIVVTGIGPVLSQSADRQRFREKYQINDPIVLFLGQHYPYKGYRHVLHATREVWKEHPEAHFVFIGPQVGGSSQVFQSFQDSRIHQLGVVSDQEKDDALAACTLLCLPSTQESFGGVYLEAWSYEKPVIGCAIPAVIEVISDGVDGFLVRQDPKEIADRIIDLLNNPALAEEMGKSGQHKVRTKYSWERVIQQTETAYKKLVT
jgi:glycosyltransferase involved in cell wall biosynthesis